jgi:iron complex outermembrane receptor protein
MTSFSFSHVFDFRECLSRWFLKAFFVLTVLLMTIFSRPTDLIGKESSVSEELANLSIEELMTVKITSVAKKAQSLNDAAAAVFAITQEDIRRSGVTSIPEALRMVPGLQVARIDANKWAISARGFNGRFANKLLVLIDGRSVYTPLYSGVYWDVQDTLLEDIDRIEVIRGPGAALWGANAVNGVINIITKHAKDTQGGFLTAGGGTEERGFGSVRYGAKHDENTFWRVYIKYFDRDNAETLSGEEGHDGWDMVRSGFRVDWDKPSLDSFTFQGDIYQGEIKGSDTARSLTAPYATTVNAVNDVNGFNFLGKWTHITSDSSDVRLQFFYDRAKRQSSILSSKYDTLDIDFQHHFSFERHEIIWGLGYRFIHDSVGNTFTTNLSPDSRDDDLLSAFVQDEIAVVKDLLNITVGSKFEHNDYTGIEIQPGVRAICTPENDHVFWAAISRAVRTPSRVEHDGKIVSRVVPGPIAVQLEGNRDYESEELISYEAGYRVLPVEGFSFDIAAFSHIYDNLRTLETGATYLATNPSPHFVSPRAVQNKMDGEAYGFELVANWRPFDGLLLQGAYTYFQMQLHLDQDSLDTTSEGTEGDSPHNQVSLRSNLDLRKDLELDLWLRYVDSLASQAVGSYVALDARLGWKLCENVELSIVGHNLLDNRHPEFQPEILEQSLVELERSIYGKITWKF